MKVGTVIRHRLRSKLREIKKFIDYTSNRYARQNYRYRKSVLSACRNLVPLDFPCMLHIELTSVCNLSCAMCPHSIMERKKEHMDFELFKTVIDQLRGEQIFTIYPYFFGESLMYPHFHEAIAYIRQRLPHVFITLSTNGVLLDNENVEKLLNSGIDNIQVSFVGGSKETYEKIMKGAKYEQAVLRIDNLIQARKSLKVEYPPNLGILTLEMPITKDEIIMLKQKWWGLVRIARAHEDYKVKRTLANFPNCRTQPCQEPFVAAMVYASGDVGVCCADVDAILTMGNAKDQTIREIWHGEGFNELRLSHKQRAFERYPICYKCPDMDYTSRRANLRSRYVTSKYYPS